MSAWWPWKLIDYIKPQTSAGDESAKPVVTTTASTVPRDTVGK